MKPTRDAVIACILVLLSTLWCGCSRPIQPIEPAPPNDLVTRLICDRLSDKNEVSAMGDTIEIKQNTGFVVQLGLVPNPQRPTEYEKRKVAPDNQWPLMVVIYPRESDDTDPKTLKGNVRSLDRLNGFLNSIEKRPQFLLYSGESKFWSAGGRNKLKIPRQPVSPTHIADWKSGKTRWYWTYMCVDKDQTGEFVYEIRMLPTAFWISPVRADEGPWLLLKRGLLRVLPTPATTSP